MTGFDYVGLNQLAIRLADHADSIVNPAAYELEADLRLASRALDRFATLRFTIGEIAEKCLSQDRGATVRDLREALKASESTS